MPVDTYTLGNPEFLGKYGLHESSVNDLPYREWDVRAERAHSFGRTDYAPTNAATQALFGIDLRDPTADKRIVEFCYAIPYDQYVVGGHSRSLARRAMKSRLPESTRMRYKRGAQGMDWYLPVAESLPALREEVELIAKSPSASAALDVPRMRKLLDDWPATGYETKHVQFLWHLGLTRAISLGYTLRTQESLGTLRVTGPPPIAPLY